MRRHGLAGQSFLARCSISTTAGIAGASLQYADNGGGTSNPSEVLAGLRGFDVVAGVPFKVNLVCDKVNLADTVNLADSWLAATFTPA